MSVRPLRNLVYVERIKREMTAGGLHIPQTFVCGKHGHAAGTRIQATPDYFEAEVLAIGPDVRELEPGDRCYVFTFADGDGSNLYTGTSDDGRRADKARRMFVKYPDDFVCAVEKESCEVCGGTGRLWFDPVFAQDGTALEPHWGPCKVCP